MDEQDFSVLSEPAALQRQFLPNHTLILVSVFVSSFSLCFQLMNSHVKPQVLCGKPLSSDTVTLRPASGVVGVGSASLCFYG